MARKKQDTIVLFPEILSVTRKLSDEQFGGLMRAVFSYRLNGEVYTGSDVAVDVAFQFISNQIDRYVDNCATNGRNASKATEKSDDAKRNEAECCEMQRNAAKSPSYPNPILSESYPILSESIESKAAKPPAPTKQVRKTFGEFGWVKLTEEEYIRLLNDLGEAEVKRCITYVDESAQATGNKNKWRDWNLVVRKCHKQGWGREHENNLRPNKKPKTIWGASGELGEAELEAIQRVLSEGGGSQNAGTP